jgi:glutaredoxin 3
MFEVYTKPACAHCVTAKSLLKSRGLEYTEVVLDVGQEKEDGVVYSTVAELKALAPGASSAPQIFSVEEGVRTHIGGFKELRELLANLSK